MAIDAIWYTRCPVPTASTVALGLGWLDEEFARDGIAVRSLASSTDRAAHRNHYNHDNPALFRFGGPIPPLLARSKGADVRIIGLSWVDRTGGIYVPASSSLQKGQLKGARLSVPRRLNDPIDWWHASVLSGYERGLRHYGLTLDDVTLVDIPIAREYAEDASTDAGSTRSLWGARSQFAVQREEFVALARGEVDAIYTDGAMGAIARAFIGLRPIYEFTTREDDPDFDGAPVVLTVSGALLDEHPDLVRRWVARLQSVQGWAKGQEARLRPLIAKDSGVPEDFVEDSYTPDVFGQFDISLSESRVQRLKTRHDKLVDGGFAQPVDFDAFIDRSALQVA